jgi:hypothetical protein
MITEKLNAALHLIFEPVMQVVNNKIASMTAAAGLITAGAARNINDISITDIFNIVPTIPMVSMYLGGTWMIICISKELFKFVCWIIKKLRDRGF